jgi:3',5'-cyclic AMP phosphodiesterase CpdA
MKSVLIKKNSDKACCRNFEDTAYDFVFFAVADPHINFPDTKNAIRLAKDSIKIFQDTMGEIEKAKTDIVVFVGDVMEARDYGMPHLELVYGLMSKISMHWLILMGNHDSRYRSTLDEYEKRDFAKKFKGHGPDGKVAYWRYDVPGKKITFVGLDTSLVGTSGGSIDNAQKKWLENTLDALAPDRMVIIFMHHPAVIFDDIISRNEGLHVYFIDNHQEMRVLFEQYKMIKAVISGHTHVCRHLLLNGINYISLPSINTWPNMYTELNISNDKLIFKNIPISDKAKAAEAMNNLFSEGSAWLKCFYNDKEALNAYFMSGPIEGAIYF